MNPHVFSITELFSGRVFTIPDYQRGYAWEREHCNDLLDDLEQLPVGYNHYTGTVVLHAGNVSIQAKDGTHYAAYDIVDGQQRITSIVILLNAIADAFNKAPDGYAEFASGLCKKYVQDVRLSDGQPFYKLTLNSDCAAYFRTAVLGPGAVAGATVLSHKRLSVAKEVFGDFLTVKAAGMAADEFYSWLIDFSNKITLHLKVGLYMVDTAAEVGVIFETMNNRGKDLTELEKVKNYLLYLSTKISLETSHELRDTINSAWSAIYTRFMSAGLSRWDYENAFLRAHWLMYYNHMRKNWDGSKSVKAAFRLKDFAGRDVELFQGLTDYVQSLGEASLAFADLERPGRADAFNSYAASSQRQPVVFWSKKIARIGTLASFRTILMACRLRYPHVPEHYLELVKLIEKYAFRVYSMGGRRADVGQAFLLKLGYELYNWEIDLDSTLSSLRASLSHHSPKSAFDRYWEFDEEDNNWYSWSSLRYFLYEYEEHLVGGGRLGRTWEELTERPLENSIEHILPQTLEDRAHYWPQRFTEDEHGTYIHDIGNLCLTYDNSTYSNHGFDVKKGTPSQESPCYANSSLQQERALTTYEDWTVESIKARRSLMTTWAKGRWAVMFALEQQAQISDEIVDEDELE